MTQLFNLPNPVRCHPSLLPAKSLPPLAGQPGQVLQTHLAPHAIPRKNTLTEPFPRQQSSPWQSLK